MRSPVHPEGFPFIALFGMLSLVCSRLCRRVAAVFALLAGFSAYFFRDPERAIPSGEGVIVSPADGRVVGIETVDQVPFLDGPAQRISIFLSIFDVHINRAPIEGKVTWRQYNPGRFLPANVPKASLDNEQNSIGIEDGGYKVLVRQIAGIIARRIVCWVDPGQAVARGERFGLIRFGSRTDLFLPLSAKVAVTVGQKVQGGSTIIAHRS
ncbi:MAG: Phosphatidylserine decarboxylase [Candidatus Ozemobacter sibiricus]|jgi:phosphatidylserine decarboxylase|uniref:Phosphatidylserine decarboxylase proenzyme n=1 Tax=Candidatus Ozemobacter sibiricus TaxID=2268124 RepID=A0A367ZKA6_9BACT|nr:MAG: Phosphatidylserine decarboxylase [Candidatus Ozemobacter sibiricus]